MRPSPIPGETLMTRFIAIAFVTVAALFHGEAFASPTIDFESLSHSGGVEFVSSPYLEDGFAVTSNVGGPTAFGTWGTSSTHFAGSTGLYNNIGLITTLSRTDSASFSVESIDLSNLFNSVSVNPRLIVTFVGTHSDSSTVTHLVDVPRFFGFQTFALPGFEDIVSMSWDQSAFESVPHQFDNIGIVPEPASVLMLALGVILTTYFRFRR